MRRVPGSGCDAPDALDGGRRGRSIADQRRAAAQARGVGAEDDLVARRAGRGVGRVTDIDVVVPGRGHQAAAVAQGHVALARGVLEERPVAHGHVAHPVRGQVAVRRVRRVRADQGRGPDGDVLAVVEVPRPIVVAQVPQGVAAHRHVLPGLGVRRERAVARGQVVSGRRRAAVRVGAHGHVVVVVRGDPSPGPGRRAAHHGEHLAVAADGGQPRAAAADGQGPRHIAGQVDGRTAAGGREATLRVHGDIGAGVVARRHGRVGQRERSGAGDGAPREARARRHTGDRAASTTTSRNGLRAQLAILINHHGLDWRRSRGPPVDARDEGLDLTAVRRTAGALHEGRAQTDDRLDASGRVGPIRGLSRVPDEDVVAADSDAFPSLEADGDVVAP